MMVDATTALLVGAAVGGPWLLETLVPADLTKLSGGQQAALDSLPSSWGTGTSVLTRARSAKAQGVTGADALPALTAAAKAGEAASDTPYDANIETSIGEAATAGNVGALSLSDADIWSAALDLAVAMDANGAATLLLKALNLQGALSVFAHDAWIVSKEIVLFPLHATQFGIGVALDSAKAAVKDLVPDWLVPVLILGGALALVVVGGVIYLRFKK